jgi:transposase InsO family protein
MSGASASDRADLRRYEVPNLAPHMVPHMVPTGLDQLWVADITYIRFQEEFAYLAIALDAFSWHLVGCALNTHLRASLVTAALTMALVSRKPAPRSLIHHSNRGAQYARINLPRKSNIHRSRSGDAQR